MELSQLFDNLPVVLIPIALVVYYSNQNNIRWMAERKEIIDALLAEQEERQAWERTTIDRQFQQQEARFAVQERVALALENLKTELHALRGTIQTLMNKYEIGKHKGSDERAS